MTDSSAVSASARKFPRYGLRTLLLAVLVVGIALQVSNVAFHWFWRYLESREYSSKQLAKQWPVASLASFVIDEGRGVPDDFVILVRRGDVFGCFIPRNQFKKGESVECEWYYRTDGKGHFSKDDPLVVSGKSFVGPYVSGNTLKIKFGPFEIPWSGSEPGWGFVYYDYNPPDRAAPDIFRICATDVKSLQYLNARNSHWNYKAYPGDRGLQGDQSAYAKRSDTSKAHQK